MNENRPCCCRKKNVRTKTVSLKFKRSELLYDCANLGYVHGDTMHTDDEHDRHQVMDIVEDGNVDRVTRILNLAMSEIREALYPYTKEEAQNAPTPITTYALFADGEYLTNEQMNDKRFLKLLSEKT